MGRATFLSPALGAALLFGIGLAIAPAWAVEFQWTPETERGVYSRVTRERVRTPPRTGFNVTVGAEVPAEVAALRHASGPRIRAGATLSLYGA